jgi:hypothetical protein
VLGWGGATERGVKPVVAEPADVLDDGELKLRGRAPHAIRDQVELPTNDWDRALSYVSSTEPTEARTRWSSSSCV